MARVEAKELVAIGDYLQRIGYFGPDYGGIIQLENFGSELEVSLFQAALGQAGILGGGCRHRP